MSITQNCKTSQFARLRVNKVKFFQEFRVFHLLYGSVEPFVAVVVVVVSFVSISQF